MDMMPPYWKIENGNPAYYFNLHRGGDCGCVVRYRGAGSVGFWTLYDFDDGPESMCEEDSNFMNLINLGESFT